MKLSIKPITLVFCAMLAGAVVAIALLLPGTLDSRRTLEIERAATPTPTADVRSMLMVTLDPNNTPAPTALLLKTGVKGDEVTRLQQRLKELGYYNGEVDGQYGPGTAEAVRVFQDQHGLDSDGIAGEATRARLYAQDAQTCVPTATPTATPSLLKKGDASDAVREMQQRLKDLGYYDGEVDGDFGGGTEEAVRLYQRQNGLDVDGIAAEKTFASLYKRPGQAGDHHPHARSGADAPAGEPGSSRGRGLRAGRPGEAQKRDAFLAGHRQGQRYRGRPHRRQCHDRDVRGR